MNGVEAVAKFVPDKLRIFSSGRNAEMDLNPGEIYRWNDRYVQYLGYRSLNEYRYAWVRLIDDGSYCIVFPRRLRSL